MHEARGLAIGLCLVVLAGATPQEALSHPLAPALLELREGDAGNIDVRFKTSLYRRGSATDRTLSPLLPAECVKAGPRRAEIDGSALIEQWRVRCVPASLVGLRVGVAGLDQNRIDALLRVEFRDGRRLSRVLRARAPSIVIPAKQKLGRIAASYAWMGARHIGGGPDHLLFVLGLLLLVSATRPLILTLTAFTVGHSVTLSLAVLGLVSFPAKPIEVMIALSVLLLAVQLARGQPVGSRQARTRLAMAMAFGFGLLHGLSFAGALEEAGLPDGEIPLALLAFNLGIEAGQLAFVLIVGFASRALGGVAPALRTRMRAVAVYAMGILAVSWCIERALEVLR